jgi:hypothetical protein
MPRLLAGLAAMTAVLQAWLFLFGSMGLEGRMWSAVSALGGVFIGGMVYAAVLLSVNLFNREEWQHIPLYAKTAAFLSGAKERRRKS